MTAYPQTGKSTATGADGVGVDRRSLRKATFGFAARIATLLQCY